MQAVINDADSFPASEYKKYLLEELFEKSLKRRYGEYMLAAHKAHCIMLHDTKILEKAIARSILRSLLRFEKKLPAITKKDFDDQLEDMFFLIEQALIADVGVEAAGALHTGRSRNDLGHTVFRMAFRDRLLITLQHIHAVAEALYDKGHRTKEDIIVAWTHAQPAQPSTYGHYVAALLEVVLRVLDRLLYHYKFVDRSPYGAAAITTTGFPIDRHQTAHLLGFCEPVLNSYGGIASTDYVLDSLGMLKTLHTHIGKFSLDQLDWARMEIHQIDVPDAWVQVSSIMPQKRNAVVFEHLRARCSVIASLCNVPADSIKNTPFGDIDDIEVEFHEQVHTIFDTIAITLPIFCKIISVIKINSKSIKKQIDTTCILATELADCLVREEQINFKQAHHIAGLVSKYCIDKAIKLSHIPVEFIEQTFERTIGRKITTSFDRIKHFLTPEHFIQSRTVYGGTSKVALDTAYEQYRSTIDTMAKTIQAQKARHKAARDRIAAEIRRVCA